MRASSWLLGSSLLIVLAAAACSSSSGTPRDGGPTDSGSHADGGADACTPIGISAATIDAGAFWGCFQQACSSQLDACAADCNCNNAIVTALACVATGGSMFSCFSSAASTNANAQAVGICLLGASGTCGIAPDGSADAPTGQ
jgi:hypothetical protein